jgi:hypothetical protein
LKSNSSFFNLEKDLFVCFLHIPIENSMFHTTKFTDVFDVASFFPTIHDCQNTYTDSYNCLPIFPRIHDYNGFSLDNIDATHTCFEEFTQLISTTQEKFPNCKLILSCATNRRDSDLFNLKVNCINAMIQEHYHNVENVHIANSNILPPICCTWKNELTIKEFLLCCTYKLSELLETCMCALCHDVIWQNMGKGTSIKSMISCWRNLRTYQYWYQKQ